MEQCGDTVSWGQRMTHALLSTECRKGVGSRAVCKLLGRELGWAFQVKEAMCGVSKRGCVFGRLHTGLLRREGWEHVRACWEVSLKGKAR